MGMKETDLWEISVDGDWKIVGVAVIVITGVVTISIAVGVAVTVVTVFCVTSASILDVPILST